MLKHRIVFACGCALLIALAACSRQQSDWQKTREANTPEAFEQFLKKYPSGEFTAQAQSQLKQLDDQRDWQKARDADTPEAYQAYLSQYPEGQSAAEARTRLENFSMAQPPAGAGSVPGVPAGGAGEPGGATSGAAAPGAAPSAPAQLAPPAAAAAGAPGAQKSPRAAHAQARRSASKAERHAGSYAVQLGAFKSGSAAGNRRWEHLQKEYPKLLAGLSSKIVPKKTAGGTLYRLQAVGLTEHEARRICKDLKARSQPCVIVHAHRA